MASAIAGKSMQAQSSIASKGVLSNRYAAYFRSIFIGMSQDPHPFLRMQMFTFHVNSHDMVRPVNLSQIRTQVELKEKHRTTREYIESNSSRFLSSIHCLICATDLEPARMKFPLYIEKDKCIPFDAGLLHKIKRQIIIRIHWNHLIYTFESDLDALKKIADGRRHRVKTSSSLIKVSACVYLVHFHATGSSRNGDQI